MKIKSLTLTIALIHLLSSNTIAEAENINTRAIIETRIDNMSPLGNNIYKNENNQFFRLDNLTGKYKNISIFDDENIKSKQYGANQRVFDTNFEKLIVDPLIWEELQVNNIGESYCNNFCNVRLAYLLSIL